MEVGEKAVDIEGTVGVKQGDNLGPILFIIVTNAVAETLNKKWKFKTPDLRWHGMKEDGTIDRRTKPSLKNATKWTTKGQQFTITNSFYVDDGAFILLSRADLEAASKLIKDHFRRFGLTVHCGDKRNNETSKTEAMFIAPQGYETQPEDIADIMLNSNEYFGFCDSFKYLGTTFDNKLDDSTDVQKRIKKATAAFGTMSKLLKDQNISTKLRVRAYEATVLNILLFGCESWALKIADRKKLEAFHHRFLRSMLNISMLDVKENHITNENVRRDLGNCYTAHQSMELRRARWLEKLAKMDATRNPRKILVAWMPNPRPLGRPFQSTRKAYALTLENLDLEPDLHSWTPTARDNRQWANRVEEKLSLTPGTYHPYKLRTTQSSYDFA